MLYKYISVILATVGSVGLISSLSPANYICTFDKKNCLSWKTLGALILFFVAGYFVFIYMVLNGLGSLVELEVAFILCGGGIFVPLVIRMSIKSINRVKKISARQHHLAAHDPLTDLPNRSKLLDCIDHEILKAEKTANPVSLLLLDIDRFKEINEALGYQYGDYILQLVATRLDSCSRSTDTISRMGGDKFALVLPGVGVDQAISTAGKLMNKMEEPFSIEDYNLNIDVTIGISMFPEHGKDSELLLQRADIAMSAAKRLDGKLAVYSSDQDKYAISRLKLIEELREAIKNNRLVLHYQPKIFLEDGCLCGVEVLVRWNHVRQYLIYPDEFVPLAEQTGLIKSLTLWVVDNALQQKSDWKKKSFDVPLAINISIKDLQDQMFPFHVKKLFEKYKIDPAGLTFEITESSMMLDSYRTHEVISRLRTLGIKISIDDFGTGYSSLAYLKQLSANEIKIDKSFVLGMVAHENDAMIVKSTIDLAKNMGLQVVAEGVEDKNILDHLTGMGCHVLQGHHLCPPVSADELFFRFSPSKLKQ